MLAREECLEELHVLEQVIIDGRTGLATDPPDEPIAAMITGAAGYTNVQSFRLARYIHPGDQWHAHGFMRQEPGADPVWQDHGPVAAGDVVVVIESRDIT